MKFSSGREADPQHPGAEFIHVRTLAGHTAVVGPEPRELPEILHSAAINAGCQFDKTSGQIKSVKPKNSPQAVDQSDEKGLITKAIKALLKKNDEADFTADGIPKVASVTAEVGFTATKGDVLAAWEALNADAAT